MRKNFRRAGIVLLALSFLGGGLAQANDIPDEQFTMRSLGANGERFKDYGVFYQDTINSLKTPSVLTGFNGKGRELTDGIYCSSLEDKKCVDLDRLNFKTFLGVCEDSADIDCIESVYAVSPTGGNRIDGKLKFTMPETLLNPFKGDAVKGIPDGGNPAIWSIPGVPNQSGSDDYAVLVEVSGDLFRGESTPIGDNFSASIFPVKLINDTKYKRWRSEISSVTPGGDKRPTSTNSSQLDPDVCAIVDDGLCAMRQSFPEGYEFGLSIRFSDTVNGWLHGRLSNPKIEYEIKSYGTRIALQGKSIKVPIVAGYVPGEKMTEQVKAQVKNYSTPGGYTNPGSYLSESFNIWNKLLGDKAVASPSQWIFYSLSAAQVQGSNQCIRNSKTLAGFVTTNSTTYYAGPPVFNRDTQSLDYQVASAHLLKDGSVFQGEYDLYIDSKVARCIYQFSSAPISATISIVNETGEAKIATTTVRESGGWIHLAASGFTFSSPTVKVKLTQAAGPSKTGKAPVKKSTITCVKGKTSKMVTGSKPVCPVGYKKK